MKRIAIGILILLILITPVCGEDINGIEFNIPEGFNEFDGTNVSDDAPDMGSQTLIRYYINEYNGVITIAIIDDFLGMSLDELKVEGANKTKINGHTGWKYSTEELNYFSYVEDDRGIIVGVTNETRLAEVIK